MQSESTNELSAALAKAQAANDARAESLAIQALTPLRLRGGRQHSFRPLHCRLMERVAFGVTECWHWRGVTNEFGYGRFSFEGRTQVAHRLSFEAFRGPIPDGMSVLHRCDNPSCINPDHLWLGTYSDNRRDCQDKGRWKLKRSRRGFEHQRNVVTPAMLAEMREARKSGLSYAATAKRVGVSAMTVWHAINRRFGEQS